MNEWGEKSRKNLNLCEVFQDEWNNIHPCIYTNTKFDKVADAGGMYIVPFILKNFPFVCS